MDFILCQKQDIFIALKKKILDESTVALEKVEKKYLKN